MIPSINEMPVSRRQAFKIGGITVSLAALVAACGNSSTGGSSPGRVGYAPAITDPPEYAVDDSVLLRTAASLENTIIYVYEQVLKLDVLDAGGTALMKQFISKHQTIADDMNALTEAAGGVAWKCTNSWVMDRLVTPLLALFPDTDDAVRDAFNTAVALENLGAATHQRFAVELTDPAAKDAALAAAILESRMSAAAVVVARDADGYLSPALNGEAIPTDPSGVAFNYAVTDRFGSIGQADLVVGQGDANGKRADFTLQTPAENSYIYNELEPTC